MSRIITLSSAVFLALSAFAQPASALPFPPIFGEDGDAYSEEQGRDVIEEDQVDIYNMSRSPSEPLEKGDEFGITLPVIECSQYERPSSPHPK